jgi:hypothetical protein
MSDIKSTEAWHIQNLIEQDDDCQVVRLDVALKLEAANASLASEVMIMREQIEELTRINEELQAESLDLTVKLGNLAEDFDDYISQDVKFTE